LIEINNKFPFLNFSAKTSLSEIEIGAMEGVVIQFIADYH